MFEKLKNSVTSVSQKVKQSTIETLDKTKSYLEDETPVPEKKVNPTAQEKFEEILKGYGVKKHEKLDEESRNVLSNLCDAMSEYYEAHESKVKKMEETLDSQVTNIKKRIKSVILDLD